MAVRPIDAVQVLHNINLHHRPTPVSEFESGFNDGLNQAMWEITHVPTLTQPNKPLTLEELKAEAKRQGYKLIKDENIQFEPCLCGGTRREWWSGPEGHKVVCLRCGLESPWVPRCEGKNGAKKAWNAMILEKRKEQSHEDV